MDRAIPVYSYLDIDVINVSGAALNVLPPQRGKTRQTIRSFMDEAQHGDTLIYAVSSHSEAASVVKHYAEYQRELGWNLRCLLIWYAGLNRWCPKYKEIVEERKRLGPEYKQNSFCRKNCPLWKTRPIPKQEFEPGTRARYIKKYMKKKEEKASLVHGPIRIVMNKYSYRVLSKIYPDIAEALDFKHHSMVIWDGDDRREYGEPVFFQGCIRALIMRKLIDTTPRDEHGQLKGKNRRSIYGYPTIIVVPHQLLPMIIHFATIYSARVFIVIDEFDRLLQSKVPRWIAERFNRKLPENEQEWPWLKVLEQYYRMEKDKKEKNYSGAIPPVIELNKKVIGEERKGFWVKVIYRYTEVPLITLVTYELDKCRDKGKLVHLSVIGSSIPMLPRPILEYLIDWLHRYFDSIIMYYGVVEVPDHIVTTNPIEVFRNISNSLLVMGSKKDAVRATRQIVANAWGTEVWLPHPIKLEDTDSLNSIPLFVCRPHKVWDMEWNYCVHKKRKKALLLYPILRGDTVVGARVAELKLKGDYIKLGSNRITWLGGRLTRGVRLPDDIKVMIIATRGGAQDKEKGAQYYRLGDILQVVFRINSRPDIQVYIADFSLPAVKASISWFNRHVLELVNLIKKGSN